MSFFRASTASLFLLLIAACSGGNNGSSSDGGTTDGGGGGDGGNSGGDGGGGGGSCAATIPNATQPTIVADPFVGLSPSLDGSDIYYIDPTQGTDVGDIKAGLIRHIHTDGTGDETIFTPTRPIFAASVQGTSVYFFQLEADTGSGAPMHLYSVPRAGGGATMVSSYDFSAVNLETSIDLPTAEYRIGIFAVQGDDAFMDEETAISRISISTGTRTVIADGSTAQIFYPSLIGTNIVYTAIDGATAANDLYTVPASANSPGGVRVGTQTCGSTTAQWASAWSGGWICGRIWGLDAIDAAGANKSSFYDTKPVDSTYNPSPIDGTTFYAFGDGTGSTDPGAAAVEDGHAGAERGHAGPLPRRCRQVECAHQHERSDLGTIRKLGIGRSHAAPHRAVARSENAKLRLSSRYGRHVLRQSRQGGRQEGCARLPPERRGHAKDCASSRSFAAMLLHDAARSGKRDRRSAPRDRAGRRQVTKRRCVRAAPRATLRHASLVALSLRVGSIFLRRRLHWRRQRVEQAHQRRRHD